ncbi:MAG: bifunctional demethylmenaquinone methyltransferase/2-methoxy-6-polyprenyl-1,4-benzoquinol methylase UbiE [Rickettsiales bacterium]|nr:bifunctional demethylmenaquinone methyltransferase/2-methoxy-6-polyprenyl-1,4-benzoquinol methylase UbiE [Rickettsiales bacterium]
MSDSQTDFGFKRVNRDEKEHLVKGIFSNVAKKYDLMNDLMSAGVHRLWKNKMIAEINFNTPHGLSTSQNQDSTLKFIDVAGGTGDIAFRITKKAREKNLPHKIEVVDINQEMLNCGKDRAIDLNLFSHLNFTCADGEKLPFSDNSFDFFTIAFGIRNFTNIDKGLAEAYRVLKPNGKFICLEFSKVNNYFLQKFYDTYSFNVIPRIGEIILHDRQSYQYLVESIRKFPSQEAFKKMIGQAGFKNTSYQNLSFGAAAIHVGEKI